VTHLLDAMRAHTRCRFAATLLCLLACTVQGFVAQTHVHVSGSQPTSLGFTAVETDASAVASTADEGSAKHSRHNGASSCPLCQIVLRGGAAPTPTFALSLALPVAISIARYEQEPTGALVGVSFSWQGRAPPLT
jgi:Protein of unknown function (DUF2946)